MAAELLIEIFSEEIPARMQLQAQADFKSLWQEALTKKNASFEGIETYVAPQRLVVCVTALGSSTKGTTEVRRGPKTNAPEAALAGFLKSTGKTKDQLIEKDGYFYAELSEAGKSITDLLPEMLDEVVDNMPWPKTMRWYNHQTKAMSKPWIRPVRSILCVYDGKPVSFNVLGFGINTSNVTYGHRFLAPSPLIVTSFADYKQQLEKASVILDHLERQDIIKKLLSEQATSKDLQLKEDQGLLEEVAGLVDYPFAHLGHIEEKFMHLPAVVLSTSMRVHQKYFTITDIKGQIAPFFGVITNVPARADNRAMLDGLERVLRARLADAAFFYDVDMKHPLDTLILKLEHIIFHAKLGSLAQKVLRIIKLMPDQDGKRAARLCKADLLTQMVGEFPELQGVMGEIYAHNQGESAEIAAALREYYQPQGPNDDCPTAPLSFQLALVDKIDTLIGFLGVGIKPTGSKDPFGLRRSALGIIRLLVENEQSDLFIDELLKKAVEEYHEQGIVLSSTAFEETIQFIYDRLSVYLRGQDIEHDCVAAILSNKSGNRNQYNLWSIAQRAKALQAFLKTEEGEALKSAYRRAAGIVSKGPQGSGLLSLQENLLTEREEKELYQKISDIRKDYQKLLDSHCYGELMAHLASLRNSIDSFFDKVTVNCDDAQLRDNRYALLQSFLQLVDQIADFSKLQG